MQWIYFYFTDTLFHCSSFLYYHSLITFCLLQYFFHIKQQRTHHHNNKMYFFFFSVNIIPFAFKFIELILFFKTNVNYFLELLSCPKIFFRNKYLIKSYLKYIDASNPQFLCLIASRKVHKSCTVIIVIVIVIVIIVIIPPVNTHQMQITILSDHFF